MLFIQRHTSWLFMLFLLLMAGVVSPADAMRVTPLYLELASAGAKSEIAVENTQAGAITVQITLHERTTQREGDEKLAEADDAFVVFPPQAIVKPGNTQVFRIQWAGDAITASRSFYARVEQVPVDWTKVKKTSDGVQIVFNFNVAVHVVPKQAAAKLQIADVKEGSSPNGTKGLMLHVKNEGDKFAYFSEQKLLLDYDGKKTEVGPQQLRAVLKNSLLTPKSERILFIPTEQRGIPKASLK